MDNMTIGWKELGSVLFLWAQVATLGAERLVVRVSWRERSDLSDVQMTFSKAKLCVHPQTPRRA